MDFFNSKVSLIREDGSQCKGDIDAAIQAARGMVYVNTMEVISAGDRIVFTHGRGQETYLVLNARARTLDKAGYALSVRTLDAS